MSIYEIFNLIMAFVLFIKTLLRLKLDNQHCNTANINKKTFGYNKSLNH